MNRICRMVAVPLAVTALLLLGSSQAEAQVYVTPAPVVSYYYPPPVYAPSVSYYSPAPAVSYYYAPPVVYSSSAYVAPAPIYYPPTTVTTYRSGLLFPRRTIVTQYTYP
jgi:hypothetical protein